MASNNNVLYLSYDGLTDPLGQSQIIPYLLGLQENGFKITVIAFEKPDNFEKNRSRVEQALGQKIRWIPLTYHKKPPVISTVFDLWILWRQVKKIYNTSPYSIIHCRSYITSLVGIRVKRKWDVKFIFDMRGFWADERVEGGLWNLNNPIFRLIYNFFKNKERQFIKEADHIISLTENAKREITSWGYSKASISVIPTCVDLNLFDPSKIHNADQKELRKKLNIGETDFVLQYLGSWGTWYLTDEMLNLFSALKTFRPESRLLIVSQDTPDLSAFKYKTDVVVTSAPRDLVPLFISIADACVFFIKPTFSKKASSATKMGEIMAMNKPIVTNGGWGDIETIMSNYNNGLIVDPFIKDEMVVKALLQTLPPVEKPDLSLLSLRHAVSTYATIYKSLC